MQLWVMVPVGLVAVIGSAVAVALGTSKRTLTLGLGASVLTLIANSVTVVFAMRQRLVVDKADNDPVLIAQAQLEAHNISKLGLVFGGVALILAILALIRGVLFEAKDVPPLSTRKRLPDEEPDFDQISESPRSLLALVVGSLTVFSLAAAAMPLILPMPKPKVDTKLQAAFSEAEKLFEEGQFDQGCRSLEKALAEGADAKRSGRTDGESFYGECFELYVAQAQSGWADEEARKLALSRLDGTKLPLTEAQSERRTKLLAQP